MMLDPLIAGWNMSPWRRLRRHLIIEFGRRWVAEGFAPNCFEGRLLRWTMFFPPEIE